MRRKFRIVSLLLTAVLLMSVYVTPAAASQEKSRGQESMQERQDADQIQHLDAEVQVIDGQPVLKVETEEGHTDIPFEFPAYAISADGQEVAVKREGDAILLPTEDGLEAVPLKDFCAVMTGGQIMLLAEVNPLWKFPIAKAVVIAALKKAGVPVTTASINAAVRLMMAGVRVTKTSVSVGQSLIRAGVSITKTNVAVGKALKAKGVPITKLNVKAGRVLRAAGEPITQANVNTILRVRSIIIAAFAGAAGAALESALVHWSEGFCVAPWCALPARQRASFNPALMVCVHHPRHPCFPW